MKKQSHVDWNVYEISPKKKKKSETRQFNLTLSDKKWFTLRKEQKIAKFWEWPFLLFLTRTNFH